MTRLLIGGYTGDKGAGSGIMVLDDDEVTGTVPAESPSWIARHQDLPVLYAVSETDEGHVHAWSLLEGVPGESLGSGATGGAEPAHLTVDPSGSYLITVNYSGGNISVHRLGPDGSIGPRTDLVQHEGHGEHARQEQAHPHMGALYRRRPAGHRPRRRRRLHRYQLSADGQLKPDGVIAAPAGSGPRHVLPAGEYNYVTAELSGQVLVYDAGWNLVGAVPAVHGERPQPAVWSW